MVVHNRTEPTNGLNVIICCLLTQSSISHHEYTELSVKALYQLELPCGQLNMCCVRESDRCIRFCCCEDGHGALLKLGRQQDSKAAACCSDAANAHSVKLEVMTLILPLPLP